jgi:hypothetical protein
MDDRFNIGENPQYVLTLSDKACQTQGTVWILISRHVNEQEQKGKEVRVYVCELMCFVFLSPTHKH